MASGSNASTLSHCAASPSPTRTDRRRYRFPLADVFGSAFLPRLPKNAHSIVIALRPHCVVPPVPLRDPLFWPYPPLQPSKRTFSLRPKDFSHFATVPKPSPNCPKGTVAKCKKPTRL